MKAFKEYKENCNNCKHIENQKCTRFPPVYNGRGEFVFPYITDGDRTVCGEWVSQDESIDL